MTKPTKPIKLTKTLVCPRCSVITEIVVNHYPKFKVGVCTSCRLVVLESDSEMTAIIQGNKQSILGMLKAAEWP